MYLLEEEMTYDTFLEYIKFFELRADEHEKIKKDAERKSRAGKGSRRSKR